MKTLFAYSVAFLLLLLPVVQVSADTIWGVTDNQFLVSWDSASPNNFSFGTNISGLQGNERVVGIDIRQADDQFYAVGSSGRLYTINLNGVATQIGSEFSTPLDGSNFGYDFDPIQDVSRVDTNTNNNYIVDPVTGSITQVSDVFYVGGDANAGNDPNVVHIAHGFGVGAGNASELYGIDSGLDILVSQNGSSGELSTIGALGGDYTEVGGFDISAGTGTAYAALQSSNDSNSQFFQVDLQSGQLTSIGEIGGGAVITAMTIRADFVTVPEPASLAIVSLLAVMVVSRRRRQQD